MNSKNFSLIFLCLFVLSCGKSPFLKESTSDSPISFTQNATQELDFKASELRIKLLWQKGPLVSNESKLMLIVSDEDGELKSLNFELRVKLWMPNMNHGSFPVTITESSPGVYYITEAFFTMPGAWDVHFQLFDGPELIEEVLWPIEL